MISARYTRSISIGGDHATNMSTANEKMNNQVPAPFYDVLRKTLAKRKANLENTCPGSDSVARRVLEDYGAIFVASEKVIPPPVCVFTSEEQVAKFQQEAGFVTQTVGDTAIELQPEAMKQLIEARAEANHEGLDITPRGGDGSGPAQLRRQPASCGTRDFCRRWIIGWARDD